MTMPRKRHYPSKKRRAEVLAMTGCGFPKGEIALRIGCDEKTLRKYYQTELSTGATIADMMVAANLLKFASGKKGNHQVQIRAAIFWLSSRRQWAPPQADRSLPPDAPRPGDTSDAALARMDDAELYAIARGEKLH
jgi:hypothetical protein